MKHIRDHHRLSMRCDNLIHKVITVSQHRKFDAILVEHLFLQRFQVIIRFDSAVLFIQANRTNRNRPVVQLLLAR